VRFEAITLSRGALRFSALAAGEGPVVLLLHGFPDSPLTFTHQLTALAAAGYRAVAVTMRGYEPGSQPSDGDYHAVRMAEDVATWTSELADGPVHLVGHDWGANVACAAAALTPGKFSSLTMLAVPHPVRFGEAYAACSHQQQRSAYVLAFQSPGFEQEIVADDCAFLENLWRTWSPSWEISPSALTEMKNAFRQPGVAGATLEYYRQAFDLASAAGQDSAALFTRPIIVPTLGLCGRDDACVPPDIFLGAMQTQDFPVHLETACIEGAGHFLQSEQPETVNRMLLDWFPRAERRVRGH
jgi:pimeloyl-ACP methyl ester carboxylesterase